MNAKQPDAGGKAQARAGALEVPAEEPTTNLEA
jgi:hypothetical protein